MSSIGFISDIHANQLALEAVLQALDEAGCDLVLCIGDVVGYGEAPAECIAILRERDIPTVLGNHDHYVTLLMDPRLERLRQDIRVAVQWTQDHLGMEELKWLASLPKRIDTESFSLVHGAFGPKPWLYLSRPNHLAANFEHQDVTLGFSGHTHIPALSWWDRKPEHEPQQIPLRDDTVPDMPCVMVNPGSVGQPRDRDPRASCALFDPETGSLRILRVPYDVAQAQARIRRAGLPHAFADRLAEGR